MAAPNAVRHCRSDQWRDYGLRRKIHIGIDEQTLEIRAIEVTGTLCCTNGVRDSLFETSVVAGGYEQLVPYEVQDDELGVL